MRAWMLVFSSAEIKHVVVGSQGLAFPQCLIEIQHPLSLGLEVRIAWKDPTAMLPGANGVLIEPSPNGTPADFGDNAAPGDFPDQILATVTGEWLAAFFGQLAGDGLDLHHQFRGENWAGAQNEEGSPSLQDVPRRIACAIC